MRAKAGDRIVRNTRRLRKSRTSRGARAGVIERVVSEDPPRYEVRWDDGTLSVFAPAAGGATITPQASDES